MYKNTRKPEEQGRSVDNERKAINYWQNKSEHIMI